MKLNKAQTQLLKGLLAFDKPIEIYKVHTTCRAATGYALERRGLVKAYNFSDGADINQMILEMHVRVDRRYELTPAGREMAMAL